MREFLRGWKRKVGCVTLALACVFMAGWLRSQQTKDLIAFSSPRTRVQLWSESEYVTAAIWPVNAFPERWRWDGWGTTKSEPAVVTPVIFDYRIRWNLSPTFTIPYRNFVVAMALLSAYLLLSKPRLNLNQTDDKARTDSPQ